MERFFKKTLVLASIISIFIVGGCAFLSGKSAAWAGTLGSLIAIISFSLWIPLCRMFGRHGKNTKILASFIASSKLFFVGLALWYLVTKTAIDPLAFLAGLSSIVAAIFIAACTGISHKEA